MFRYFNDIFNTFLFTNLIALLSGQTRVFFCRRISVHVFVSTVLLGFNSIQRSYMNTITIENDFVGHTRTTTFIVVDCLVIVFYRLPIRIGSRAVLLLLYLFRFVFRHSTVTVVFYCGLDSYAAGRYKMKNVCKVYLIRMLSAELTKTVHHRFAIIFSSERHILFVDLRTLVKRRKSSTRVK